MTEATEVVPRPATGPSSTSIRMTVMLPVEGSLEIDWPVEWRVPIEGEMLRLAPFGVGKITHVLWDHSDGRVTAWIK